jgi:hypothetical protein
MPVKPSKLMYLHKVLDCVGVIATLANVVVEWTEMVPVDCVKTGVEVTEKNINKFFVFSRFHNPNILGIRNRN